VNWLQKTMILMFVLGAIEAAALETYRVNFGDDLWSSKLLVETCPQELKRALAQVADHYSSSQHKLVAVLPDQIDYQFFKVEFKELKDGNLVDLEKPFVYQFQYWTQYDRHERCLQVEPYNIAY